MSTLTSTINYMHREATELGMKMNLEQHGTKVFIDVSADDAKLWLIMGPRGAIKYVSYIDPLHSVGTYKGKSASYFQITNFFKAVYRQREMLAERFEEERKKGLV